MDRFLKRPTTQQPAVPSKRPHASTPAMSTTMALGSRFTECPICHRSVPLSLINEHIDSGCTATSVSTTRHQSLAPPALALPQAESPPATEHPICRPPPITQAPSAHAPCSQPPPITQPPPPKAAGPNAFEALKRGAEALKPRHVYCTLLPGPPPRLAWSTIGGGSAAAAVADAAWSCEVDLRSTPPVKLVLRQETPASARARPRDGAQDGAQGGAQDGAQDSAHDGAHDGGMPLPEWFAHSHSGLRISLTSLSVPMLKSALQKNIRLSRPIEAIRCAWALLRHVDPTGTLIALDDL